MTSPQHVCCTAGGFGADIENEAQQAPPLLEALMEQVARRTNKKKDKRPQLSAVLGVLGNCKWRREWEETTLAPLIARLHEPTFGKASVVQRRERDGGMQGGDNPVRAADESTRRRLCCSPAGDLRLHQGQPQPHLDREEGRLGRRGDARAPQALRTALVPQSAGAHSHAGEWDEQHVRRLGGVER